MSDLFDEPTPNITLNPRQSLALRRMIDAMKADDSIYSACPDVVRSAIADMLLPPFTSAESQIAALEKQNEDGIKLLEKFGAKIAELEQRRKS